MFPNGEWLNKMLSEIHYFHTKIGNFRMYGDVTGYFTLTNLDSKIQYEFDGEEAIKVVDLYVKAKNLDDFVREFFLNNFHNRLPSFPIELEQMDIDYMNEVKFGKSYEKLYI